MFVWRPVCVFFERIREAIGRRIVYQTSFRRIYQDACDGVGTGGTEKCRGNGVREIVGKQLPEQGIIVPSSSSRRKDDGDEGGATAVPGRVRAAWHVPTGSDLPWRRHVVALPRRQLRGARVEFAESVSNLPTSAASAPLTSFESLICLQPLLAK